MARETFFYPEAETLFKQLEDVSQRSSISRGQAFEDFLHVSVCALGHPLMEDEYLQTVERHKAGTKGKRGIDKLAEMFATLIDVTDKTRADNGGTIIVDAAGMRWMRLGKTFDLYDFGASGNGSAAISARSASTNELIAKSQTMDRLSRIV